MATEPPPVLGMRARGGQGVMHRLAHGQPQTIAPFIKDTRASGPLLSTEAYSMDARLARWGSAQQSVNHGRGEYARDAEGDGLCEGHGHTVEGFWALLRRWRRPHRGISQEKLPLSLGFFACVHNVRKRGKALLGSLMELLVAKDPGIQ